MEKKSYLDIEQFNVDVVTSDFVPTLDFINVKADAVVKAKIGTTSDMIAAAAQNFLGWKTKDIADSVRDVLEGNLREIIGKMDLKAMVNDRQQFAEQVQDNAAPDLAKMGLQIIAFTVQSFKDDSDAIRNLGIDNIVTIQKDAANAKAKAEREMAEVKAAQQQAANEAQVASDLEIAQKQNDLAIRKAELKKQSDVEQARADAAYDIEQQNQRKEIERTTAEAEIVKQTKQAEVKEREVSVKEQELNATVRKQAEADKYAAQQKAEAQLIERQRQADAELYEAQKNAEKQKAEAEAARYAAEQEAAGVAAKGEAEASAIQARLNAEAEGLSKKADAMKKYGEAAIVQMLVEALPEVAKNVAAPLANVDTITMYGEGNGAQMVGDIMTTMNKVSEGMGLNIPELLQATLTGRAAGNAIGQELTDTKTTPTPTGNLAN
ncbi:flotillin family protein [Bifidobacterium pseudolongum]|uniref:flotillin family protein n=1 Tax=Bifidobacterium pseudolongum TaxID=1694 RepID=UPI001A93278F|nr:flotillin family protein [Bifidobacterium pseudolongum]